MIKLFFYAVFLPTTYSRKCPPHEYEVSVLGMSGIYCVSTPPCSGHPSDFSSITCPEKKSVNILRSGRLKYGSCCAALSDTTVGCVSRLTTTTCLSNDDETPNAPHSTAHSDSDATTDVTPGVDDSMDRVDSTTDSTPGADDSTTDWTPGADESMDRGDSTTDWTPGAEASMDRSDSDTATDLTPDSDDFTPGSDDSPTPQEEYMGNESASLDEIKDDIFPDLPDENDEDSKTPLSTFMTVAIVVGTLLVMATVIYRNRPALRPVSSPSAYTSFL